jgi:hypothetical protein
MMMDEMGDCIGHESMDVPALCATAADVGG